MKIKKLMIVGCVFVGVLVSFLTVHNLVSAQVQVPYNKSLETMRNKTAMLTALQEQVTVENTVAVTLQEEKNVDYSVLYEPGTMQLKPEVVSYLTQLRDENKTISAEALQQLVTSGELTIEKEEPEEPAEKPAGPEAPLTEIVQTPQPTKPQTNYDEVTLDDLLSELKGE